MGSSLGGASDLVDDEMVHNLHNYFTQAPIFEDVPRH